MSKVQEIVKIIDNIAIETNIDFETVLEILRNGGIFNNLTK